MIGYLRGIVKNIHGKTVILDVQGVGYQISCTKNALKKTKIGEKKELLISTEVREDAIQLFGFNDPIEKQAFTLLKQVKGVGPSTALTIISAVDSKELFRHIAGNNLPFLSSLKGIGKKRAERIIVELRDRVKKLSSPVEMQHSPPLTENQTVNDAVSTLLALGFNKKEALSAVEAAINNNSKKNSLTDAGEIAKEALRYI